MRADQAKAIPMQDLLAALGHTPAHQQGHDLWYRSPFREESQPSFKVNTQFNSWYDFGEGKGGNIIAFAQAYFHLGDKDVSGALREIEHVMGSAPRRAAVAAGQAPLFPDPVVDASPAPVPAPAARPASGITLKKIQPLQNKALLQYLEKRAIPADVARPYLQEAYYTVAGRDRTYFALAFPNQAGGYELRNPYFQGVAGSKDISLVLPDLPELFEVVVFEGFMDFLSARAQWRDALPPALVLNSVALKDKAVAAIQEHGFSHVRLYLDRDASGRKLTGEFQALEGLTVVDASGVYDGFKDFNEWLIRARQHEKC